MMKPTSQYGDTIVEPSVLGCDVLKKIGKSRAGIAVFHHSYVFHHSGITGSLGMLPAD